MILARFRRARRRSAVAALLCTLVASFNAFRTSVAGERQIRERVAVQGEMMSGARAAVIEVARRLGSQDRSADGILLVPRRELEILSCDVCLRAHTPPSVEPVVASRPRRLAFRYEATAPPLAR